MPGEGILSGSANIGSRRENGITPDLLRISMEIEAIEDILEDFDQALRTI